MCKVGSLNLSYESLTGLGARQLLCKLPTSDPDFYAELSMARTRVTLTPDKVQARGCWSIGRLWSEWWLIGATWSGCWCSSRWTVSIARFLICGVVTDTTPSLCWSWGWGMKFRNSFTSQRTELKARHFSLLLIFTCLFFFLHTPCFTASNCGHNS